MSIRQRAGTGLTVSAEESASGPGAAPKATPARSVAAQPTATATASPQPSSDAPPVTSDLAVDATEDVSVSIVLAPGLLNAYVDDDGDLASGVQTRNVSSGSVSEFSCAGGVCTATYTPALNANGSATFEYLLTAGGVDAALWKTVTVAIAPADDAPLGNGLSLSGLENESLTVTLSPGAGAGYTDIEGDLATSVANRNVVGGALGPWNCVAGQCTATFTPTNGFVGTASFESKVTAGASQALDWSITTLQLAERAKVTVTSAADFGTVDAGSLAEVDFTLLNTSAATAATGLTLPTLSSPFSLVSEDCDATLAPAAQCTVRVRYQPTALSSQTLTYTVDFDANGALAGGATSASDTAMGAGRPVIEAAYPTNGLHWNTWVERGSLASNLFSQTDAACNVTTATKRTSCFHGGEIRKARVLGKTSCANLSATDSAGAFEWSCEVVGGEAWMFSLLAPGKGLRQLVRATPTLSWVPLSMSITESGQPLGTSASTAWWTTPLELAPTAANEPTPSRAQMITGDAPKVWVVPATAAYPPLEIEGSHGSLVTLTGATIQYDGSPDPVCKASGATTRTATCNLYLGRENFVWIEADIDGHHATTPAEWGINLFGVRFAMVRNTSTDRTGGDCVSVGQSDTPQRTRFLTIRDSVFSRGVGDDCLDIQQTSDMLLENVRIGSTFDRSLYLRDVDDSVFRNVIANGAGQEAVILTSVSGGHSTGNVLQGVNVVGAREGFRISPSNANNIVMGGLVANVAQDDSTDGGDSLSWSAAGFDIQGPNNLLSNVMAHNTAYFPLIVRVENAGSGGCPSTSNATGTRLHNIAVLGSKKNYSGTSSLRDCAGTDAATSSTQFSGWLMHDAQCVFTYQANQNVTNADCNLPGVSGMARRKFAAATEYNSAWRKWATPDGVNTTSVNGSGEATHASSGGISAFDWRAFAHWLRGWIRSATELGDSAAVRRCEGTLDCKIADYALQKTDATFLGMADMVYNAGTTSWDGDQSSYVSGALRTDWSASACPSAAHGNKTLTWNGNTFLVNAFESLDDGQGDDDGLCESNEACVYTPNAGAYQGHGSLRTSGICAFSTGTTVTGVQLYAPASNGY